MDTHISVKAPKLETEAKGLCELQMSHYKSLREIKRLEPQREEPREYVISVSDEHTGEVKHDLTT